MKGDCSRGPGRRLVDCFSPSIYSTELQVLRRKYAFTSGLLHAKERKFKRLGGYQTTPRLPGFLVFDGITCSIASPKPCIPLAYLGELKIDTIVMTTVLQAAGPSSPLVDSKGIRQPITSMS
ncbi:hypothetical protein KC352_g46 [Hortaea werneckii]|nr:hypothetical protein KC352_g46 [Hortaea werneckii]